MSGNLSFAVFTLKPTYIVSTKVLPLRCTLTMYKLYSYSSDQVLAVSDLALLS